MTKALIFETTSLSLNKMGKRHCKYIKSCTCRAFALSV